MKKLEPDTTKYNNSIATIKHIVNTHHKVTIDMYNNIRDVENTYSRQQMQTLYQITFNDMKRLAEVPSTYYNNNLGILLEDSKESYYWAGFLFADGWVTKDYSEIGLALAVKDIEHLNSFRKYVGYTGAQTKLIVSITNPSVKDIADKFCILENKSHSYLNYDFYENLPYDLWVSWFIGYTDGDGSIIARPDRPNLVNIRYVAGIANLEFHTRLLKDVKKRIDTCDNNICFENETILRWRISKKSICRELKKQSLQLPVLARKWSRIRLYDMV